MANYYVHLSGSDTNPGTQNQPFKTIAKAVSIAQAGDTIYLREGEYRETVVFNRSGTAEAPITLTGYPGETATVSGLEKIENWQPHQGKIWKASMPWTVYNEKKVTTGEAWSDDQVFVNKDLMVAARWPSIEPGRLTEKRSQDMARAGKCSRLSQTRAAYGDHFSEPFPGAWVGAKINYWGYYNNVPTTGTVTAVSGGRIEFEDPFLNLSEPYAPQYLQPSDKNFFYLWGKLELLTDPGEFFRSPEGTLYLWLPNNDDPNRQLVEAKRREWGLEVSASHIHVKNITLFACAFNLKNSSSNCLLEGINVYYTWNALNLHRLFWTFQKFGCSVDGARHNLRNCEFHNSALSHLILKGRGHRVEGCVFTRSTYEAGHATVFANSSGPEFHEFNRCTFAIAGGHHVRIGQRTHYRYCDLYRSHLQTSDLGVFHGWGTDCAGSEIAYNWIHDSTAADCDPAIKNYHCCGILLDHSIFGVSVYRNLLWNTDSPAIVHLGLRTDALPRNKTLSSPLEVKIFHNTAIGDCGPGQNLDGIGIEIANNIFATTHTSLPRNAAFKNNHQLSDRNPRFRNPAKQDFRLLPSSPAIGKGTCIDSSHETPSIGAFESGETRLWSAGAPISETDLKNLQVSASWDGENVTVEISNLPPYRTLPSDFQVLIGNKSLDAPWLRTFDADSNDQIYEISAPPPVYGSDLPVALQLGNTVWKTDCTVTADISAFVSTKLAEIEVILPDPLTSVYRLYLDTSFLVAAGQLDPELKQLRVLSPSGKPIEFWAENANSQKTGIWFRTTGLSVGSAVKFSFPHPPRTSGGVEAVIPILHDPDNILWLRANEGVELSPSGAVVTWKDSSHEGHDARGATYDGKTRTFLKEPLFVENAIAGMPAISFDGSQGLDVPHDLKIALKQPRTVFVVLYRTEQFGPILGVDSGNYLEAGNNTNNGTVSSTGFDRLRIRSQQTVSTGNQNLYSPNGSFGRERTLILCVRSNGDGVVARLNGQPLVASPLLYQHYAISNNFKIGRHQVVGWNNPPSQFKGLISEIILFDRDITDPTPVEEYLSIKYALSKITVSATVR